MIMKQPKRPVEPYAPYKPIEPKKTITANTLLLTKCISTYDKYSVEELFGKRSDEQLILRDVCVEFEIEKTWDYDDYTCNIITHTYSTKEIPDPDYDKNYKAYLKSLEKYKEAQKKFKEKKKQYKLDLEKYNLEFDKWLLNSKKQQVKTLEERLAKSQNV